MKQRTLFLLALGLLLLVFSACGGCPETITVYEGNALKVEREGSITRLYDLEGGGSYSFRKERIKARNGAGEPRGMANTSYRGNLKIVTVYGLIIVTTKDGETIYIK